MEKHLWLYMTLEYYNYVQGQPVMYANIKPFSTTLISIEPVSVIYISLKPVSARCISWKPIAVMCISIGPVFVMQSGQGKFCVHKRNIKC